MLNSDFHMSQKTCVIILMLLKLTLPQNNIFVLLGKLQAVKCIMQNKKVFLYNIYYALVAISLFITLYFVSSRERPWRHSACWRINAEQRIIWASIPGFLFERVRKYRSYARDNKRAILYHALTSRSFSRWDKV